MNVFEFPNKPENYIFPKSKMILGSFASIHKGHFVLFKKYLEQYPDNLIVCIIENANAVPNKNLKIFSDIQTRLEDLAKIGIKNVVKIKFDDVVKNTVPESFINILTETYNVEQFIIGRDYQYGKKASGNASTLKEMKPNTKIVELVKHNKSKIATSLLNCMLSEGELDVVNRNLINLFARRYDIENNKLKNKEIYSLIHSGLYFARIYEPKTKKQDCNLKTVYNALIHVNLANKATIYFLDNNYESKTIISLKSVKIEFISLFKKIEVKQQDYVDLSKIQNLRNFFNLDFKKVMSYKNEI